MFVVKYNNKDINIMQTSMNLTKELPYSLLESSTRSIAKVIKVLMLNRIPNIWSVLKKSDLIFNDESIYVFNDDNNLVIEAEISKDHFSVTVWINEEEVELLDIESRFIENYLDKKLNNNYLKILR